MTRPRGDGGDGSTMHQVLFWCVITKRKNFVQIFEGYRNWARTFFLRSTSCPRSQVDFECLKGPPKTSYLTPTVWTRLIISPITRDTVENRGPSRLKIVRNIDSDFCHPPSFKYFQRLVFWLTKKTTPNQSRFENIFRSSGPNSGHLSGEKFSVNVKKRR